MLLLLLIFFICLYFFLMQKTAYEMRISDWSSDVCSSDLALRLSGVRELAVCRRYGRDSLRKAAQAFVEMRLLGCAALQLDHREDDLQIVLQSVMQVRSE